MVGDSAIYTTVGQRIRDLRLRRKWTQKQLGERCNYSQEFISNLERGDRDIKVRQVQEIAIALEIDYLELLR